MMLLHFSWTELNHRFNFFEEISDQEVQTDKLNSYLLLYICIEKIACIFWLNSI